MKVSFSAKPADIVKWLESNVEKILLGLGGVYLLVMAYLFIINSPNTIQFDNKPVTPGELNPAINASAERLKSAFDKPNNENTQVKKFSDELKKEHEAGVLGAIAGQTPLKPNLRQATHFGTRIEIPGLEPNEARDTAVALVTPLAPTQPVVRMGRSMVSPRQVRLSTGPEASAADAGGEDVEQPWVSIASYFDEKGQQAELGKAGYSAARQKVYVVGVDVQRREKLASGEWSDWQDVKPGKAMPTVDIAEPKIDDVSGAISNRSEVDAAFQLVKAYQNTLMQPPFPSVSEGDEWKMPALAGFEDKEEDETAKVAVKKTPEKKQETRRAPVGPAGGGGRSGRFAGGGIEGGGGLNSGAASDEKAKKEARDRAAEDLKKAQKAAQEKKWADAKSAAEEVERNDEATKTNKDLAAKIVKEAEHELEKENKTAPQQPIAAGNRGVRTAGGALGPRDAGGGMRAPTAAPAAAQATTLIRNPSTNTPAVWYHDDSVESGKTYSYRMRVRLWNRYVGQTKFVKNVDDAHKAFVAGEWSAPSEPVTVTPSTYFFAKAAKPGGGASVDIWKWRKGKWIKQSFDVGVGDVIGAPRKVTTEDDFDPKNKTEVDFTTGAVVLDIRASEAVKVRVPGKNGAFTERDQTSLVLVYLDPSDGQVKERVPALDKYDPMRKVLEGEGS